MTRRREVPTLAFTVPEAAEAIRLSENTLRLWIREGIVRVVRWQSLDLVPRVELDRLITEALDNGGTPPAVASSPTSTVPPAVSQVGEHGAAGPHGTGIYGEVGPTAGRSGARRPAAPTTKKTPLVAASGVPNNAG